MVTRVLVDIGAKFSLFILFVKVLNHTDSASCQSIHDSLNPFQFFFILDLYKELSNVLWFPLPLFTS